MIHLVKLYQDSQTLDSGGKSTKQYFQRISVVENCSKTLALGRKSEERTSLPQRYIEYPPGIPLFLYPLVFPIKMVFQNPVWELRSWDRCYKTFYRHNLGVTLLWQITTQIGFKMMVLG